VFEHQKSCEFAQTECDESKGLVRQHPSIVLYLPAAMQIQTVRFTNKRTMKQLVLLFIWFLIYLI